MNSLWQQENGVGSIITHLAFEVADLDYELATRNLRIIAEPNLPPEGIRVAMVEHNGAPIELIEFNKSKS